jgi:hypothetical protein
MERIKLWWIFNIYQPFLDTFCYGLKIRTFIRWKFKGII